MPVAGTEVSERRQAPDRAQLLLPGPARHPGSPCPSSGPGGCACSQPSTRAHAHTHTCTCTHAQVHAHMHKCTRTHTHTCTARPCTPACGARQTPTSWTRFLISRFAACRSSGWLLFRSLVRSCRVTEQVAEPSVSTPEAVSARGANTFQPRHPAEPPQCGGATSVTTTPTDPRSVGTGRAGGLHPSGHLATSETLWLAQLGMLLASSG